MIFVNPQGHILRGQRRWVADLLRIKFAHLLPVVNPRIPKDAVKYVQDQTTARNRGKRPHERRTTNAKKIRWMMRRTRQAQAA
jgi:hypothetical protein